VCTTSPLSASSYFVPEIQGMAVQQSVYAAVANRVGQQVLRPSGRRTEFLGSSVIAGPLGEILALAPARDIRPAVGAKLAANQLRDIRAAHQFHERRRPDTHIASQK
jgi:predicted amidohydrolase